MKDFNVKGSNFIEFAKRLKSFQDILLSYSVKAILSNSFMLGHLGMTSDQSFCPLHTTLLLNQPHKNRGLRSAASAFPFSVQRPLSRG